MRDADIKSPKLQAKLRLARELKISPWYLAGDPEPTIPLNPKPAVHGGARKQTRSARQTLERRQFENCGEFAAFA